MIGYKYLVRVTDWPANSHYPNAVLLQTLGEENHYQTDSVALLYEAGVGDGGGVNCSWRRTWRRSRRGC